MLHCYYMYAVAVIKQWATPMQLPSIHSCLLRPEQMRVNLICVYMYMYMYVNEATHAPFMSLVDLIIDRQLDVQLHEKKQEWERTDLMFRIWLRIYDWNRCWVWYQAYMYICVCLFHVCVCSTPVYTPFMLKSSEPFLMRINRPGSIWKLISTTCMYTGGNMQVGNPTLFV